MIRRLYSLVLVAIVLASCSTTSKVMSDGKIQKRKYLKGYHLNFTKPNKNHVEEFEEGVQHLNPITADLQLPSIITPQQNEKLVLCSKTYFIEISKERVSKSGPIAKEEQIAHKQSKTYQDSSLTPQTVYETTDNSNKTKNIYEFLGIVFFTLEITAIVFSFLLPLAFFFAAFGLIFSIIGLRKAERDGSSKALSIVGIVVNSLIILLSLLVLLVIIGFLITQ